MIEVDVTKSQVITLGRSGEYGEHDAVSFNISAIIEAVGEGTATLYFRRIYGEDPYIPINVTVRDGIITWIPSETDLGLRSDSGYCEVRYEYNGGRVVTKKNRVIIKDSLSDDVTGKRSLGEEYFDEIASYMAPILNNHIIPEDFYQSMQDYMVENPVVTKVNGLTGDVTLTAIDVHALPEDTYIPIKVSDLENDAGFLTEHQDISGKANTSDLATVATSGDYSDLTNKPENVSVFNNDAGYLVAQDIEGKANADNVYTKQQTDDLLNDFVSEFIVTVTKKNGSYSANKTFAELIEASEIKSIICEYDNLKLPMLKVSNESITFQDISMTSGILTGTSITITNNNSVSLVVEHIDEAVKSVNGKIGTIVLGKNDIGIYQGTKAEIDALIKNGTIKEGDAVIITDDAPDSTDNIDFVMRSEFVNAMNNKVTAIGTPTDGQFLVYSSSANAYVPTTVISADNIQYGGGA